MTLFQQNFYIAEYFSPKADAILHKGDALQFLEGLPSKSIALVVTSPPYNIGKPYEDPQDIQSYLSYQRQVIQQIYRVLREDGSVCWQVGNYVEKGEVYPLDILYYPLFKEVGFKLRNRIIWRFGHGLHASKRFSGRYETILWFSRSDHYFFNLDPVRIPSKYPGKRHYKGPNKGKPSGNPLGKNPSDVWEVLVSDWDALVWDIPNVKSNHPEKTIHPCQFPIELAERCILAMTREGDWVLDPYAGVGTTLIAALLHGRRGIAIEKESAYIEVTRQRIAAFLNGTLKYRKLGTPIYQPTGRERVAQIPEEWKRNAT